MHDLPAISTVPLFDILSEGDGSVTIDGNL
jgi:hypothetical protein